MTAVPAFGVDLWAGDLLVLTDDWQGKLNELSPGLSRSAGDLVQILLAVHEGEMELPELFWGDAGLRKG